MGNTFGRKTATYDSGFPVWKGVPERVVGVGKLLNAFAEGYNYPAGSPCSLEAANGVKILPTWKVKATSVTGGTNTIITVYRADGLHDIVAGKIVMVAPATIAGTGKAFAVTTVDNSVVGESTFTIVTAAADTIAVGTILALSASATEQAAQALYCQPTHLTYSQILIETGDTIATASPVFKGYVFEKRIPFLSPIMKANIRLNTDIYFDNII